MKFKIGDKVIRSGAHEKGTVVDVILGNVWPYVVHFEGRTDSLSLGGDELELHWGAPDQRLKKDACTCGAASVGSSGHSTWCDSTNAVSLVGSGDATLDWSSL